MSTRSAIGMEMLNGKIAAVYCHNDGYPDYNGRILQKHWDRDKILALLSEGELSVLGEDMDTTVFYHRDRGEKFVPAHAHSNPADYLANFPVDVEWFYLLTLNGVWTVSKGRSGPFEHVGVAIYKEHK